MAFVSNMDNEEEKTDQPTAAQGPVSPTGGGGGAVRLAPSSSVPTVGGGGTAGTGKTPATAGGSFASLDKYLSANQDQAPALTNRLTSSVGQQYSDLDAQNNATIANLNSQVKNAPGYTVSDPNVLASESANPVSFANDPNNVKQFQSLLQNTYSGPASAEGTADYAARQSDVNNAIATGQANTTTEAGRQNLLTQNEATPTSGVTALNSAIISQDPNSLSAVENAYKPFGNLLTNLQTGAQGVDTTIGKEQADATSSSKAANDAIASQIGALNTGVTGELTAAQQNATAQNDRLKADLANGFTSDADLSALGMTRDQWNALSAANRAAATAQTVSSDQGQFNAASGTTAIDPTQFLTEQDPNAAFTIQNIATTDDYNKAQAFQNLLGGLNLNSPAAIINPLTVKQAGTAPTNLNNYDYQAALNTANTTKSDEVAAAQAYVNALQSGADENHARLAAADTAGRQKKEQLGEAASMIGLPIAIASNLPVVGKPIANAVDTVVQAVSGGSWVCTAMLIAGAMTAEEVNKLHNHVYRARARKLWSFFKYAILGKPLVFCANKVGINWTEWKPLFYERVMAEQNPVRAVELYEESFWSLFRTVRQQMLGGH